MLGVWFSLAMAAAPADTGFLVRAVRSYRADPGGAVRKRVGPTALKVVAGVGLLTGQLEIGNLEGGVLPASGHR